MRGEGRSVAVASVDDNGRLLLVTETACGVEISRKRPPRNEGQEGTGPT